MESVGLMTRHVRRLVLVEPDREPTGAGELLLDCESGTELARYERNVPIWTFAHRLILTTMGAWRFSCATGTVASSLSITDLDGLVIVMSASAVVVQYSDIS